MGFFAWRRKVCRDPLTRLAAGINGCLRLVPSNEGRDVIGRGVRSAWHLVPKISLEATHGFVFVPDHPHYCVWCVVHAHTNVNSFCRLFELAHALDPLNAPPLSRRGCSPAVPSWWGLTRPSGSSTRDTTATARWPKHRVFPSSFAACFDFGLAQQLCASAAPIAGWSVSPLREAPLQQ